MGFSLGNHVYAGLRVGGSARKLHMLGDSSLAFNFGGDTIQSHVGRAQGGTNLRGQTPICFLRVPAFFLRFKIHAKIRGFLRKFVLPKCFAKTSDTVGDEIITF